MSTFSVDLETLDRLDQIIHAKNNYGNTLEYLASAYPNLNQSRDWSAIYRDLGWWLFYEEMLHVARNLKLVHLYATTGSSAYTWYDKLNYWHLIKFETETDFEHAYNYLVRRSGLTGNRNRVQEQHPSGKVYDLWAFYYAVEGMFVQRAHDLDLHPAFRNVKVSFTEFYPERITLEQAGCVERVTYQLGTSNLSALNWLVNQNS